MIPQALENFTMEKLLKILLRTYIREVGFTFVIAGCSGPLRLLLFSGGIITMEDLAHYKADVQPAIQTTLADKSKVHGVPPPAGGLIVQHILAIMDGYDYGNKTKSWKDMNDQEKILFYQRFAEAMKFAYARRAEMGDKTYEPQVAEVCSGLCTHNHFLFKNNVGRNQEISFGPRFQSHQTRKIAA